MLLPFMLALGHAKKQIINFINRETSKVKCEMMIFHAQLFTFDFSRYSNIQDFACTVHL
jgi:hypothetical protein